MISSGRLFWTTLLAALTTTAIGCESVVTEYHRRSSFYRMASEVELVDEYVDAQGRRVVFIEDGLLPSEQDAFDEASAARAEAKAAIASRNESVSLRPLGRNTWRHSASTPS